MFSNIRQHQSTDQTSADTCQYRYSTHISPNTTDESKQIEHMYVMQYLAMSYKALFLDSMPIKHTWQADFLTRLTILTSTN